MRYTPSISSNIKITFLAWLVSLARILQKILNFPVVTCATVTKGICAIRSKTKVVCEVYDFTSVYAPRDILAQNWSREIVDTDITEVVDSAVAGISGVKTITSQSSRGRSRTVIEFELGRDIDEAANDVRDAVGRVRGNLPDEVDDPRIVKNDSDADPVMRLAVTSDRMNAAEITDYIERFIKDRITTLEGVATVAIYGERRAAMRTWLDRRAMAARNLTAADVAAALPRHNVVLPAGRTRQGCQDRRQGCQHHHQG